MGSPAGANAGFVGPEAYNILGALFNKKECKIRHEREYLLRVTN